MDLAAGGFNWGQSMECGKSSEKETSSVIPRTPSFTHNMGSFVQYGIIMNCLYCRQEPAGFTNAYFYWQDPRIIPLFTRMQEL